MDDEAKVDDGIAGAVDVDEGLLGSEASRWHHWSILLVASSYSSCITALLHLSRSLENYPSLRGPLLEELGKREGNMRDNGARGFLICCMCVRIHPTRLWREGRS